MEILHPKGRGKLQDRTRFTGKVWINDLKSVPLRILRVTSEPKSRSHWHNHPSGQVLIVLSGKGRVGVNRSGRQIVKEIKAGDIVFFEPGEIHWHGAAPDKETVHIAIHLNSDFSRARMVSDEEYGIDKKQEITVKPKR
ncbi:MAG: cupin domain-containing protein [Thaumarchaeota archaeon]|nr:cupin domain-containing protein [Nitrososphaerota archaeon]